jgi:putative transposase
LHKSSAKIVEATRLIATETLNVQSMTRSAKGTMKRPGRNVAQKAGLNREILSTAPGAYLNMLRYKAEEAGSHFANVPTRKVRPSQTCSGCGSQRKRPLSERMHACECGLSLSRDQNASRVMLQWALTALWALITGWESRRARYEAIAS